MNFKLVCCVLMITTFSSFGQLAIDPTHCLVFKLKDKQLGQICDAYNKLIKFYEYKGYAEGVFEDIKANVPVRKLPPKITGSKTLIVELNDTKLMLDNIIIDDEIIAKDNIFPVYEDLTSDNQMIRRKAISLLLLNRQELYQILKEYKVLRSDLNNFNDDAKKVKQASQKLQKEFFKLSENSGNGLTVISNIFGFAALDLLTHVSPILGEIVKTSKQKAKVTNDLVAKESRKLKRSYDNSRFFIDAEKDFLIKKIKFLKTKNKENEAEVIKTNELQISELNQIRTQAEKMLQESNKKISVLKQEYKVANNELDPLDKRVSERKKALKSHVFKCPNNKSWENCTSHPDIKEAFLNRQRELKDDYNYAKGQRDTKAKEASVKLKAFNNMTAQSKKEQLAFKKKLVNKEKEFKNQLNNLKLEQTKTMNELKQLEQFLTQNSADLLVYNSIGL